MVITTDSRSVLDYTWHLMPPSGHRHVPSAHVTTIHEVVREVSVEIEPGARMEAGASSMRAGVTSSMEKSRGAALIHEDSSDANVGKSMQSKPPTARVTMQQSVQSEYPNKALGAANAATNHVVTSLNGTLETEGINAIDGINAEHGIAGIAAQEERNSATKSRSKNDSMPRAKKPRAEPVMRDFVAMESDNSSILAQDSPGTWDKGISRFRASAKSAGKVLSWVVENTSRKLSVVATDTLLLDGFHEWDAVHASTPDDARQLQHTFVIARAQRRAALSSIPGFANLVADAQLEIKSLQLTDAPEKLEWLTGHILNQGDVNARFEYHQDTSEERNKETGRRDRRVMYTAIVKLNHGGCTSMEVCGEPEVFYHSPSGSGVIFRSNLHHRTEKAEQGIWKLALFFGVFM